MKNFLLLLLLLCVIVASVTASDFSLAGMWQTRIVRKVSVEIQPENKLITFRIESPTNKEPTQLDIAYTLEGSEQDSVFHLLFEAPEEEKKKNNGRVAFIRMKTTVFSPDSIGLQVVAHISSSGETKPPSKGETLNLVLVRTPEKQ